MPLTPNRASAEPVGHRGASRLIEAEPPSGWLAQVLNAVRIEQVDATRLTATVQEHEVTADSARALSFRLATALYQVVHSGRESVRQSGERLHRDLDLQSRLQDAVPHRYTRYTATSLGGERRRPVVELSGVRVRLAEEDFIHEPPAGPQGAEVQVRVAAVRPALSPGFLLVDGSRPLTSREHVLRVYVHVRTASAAVEAWRATLRCLEARKLPYRAKAASALGALPRRDGIVVYLDGRDPDAAIEIASATAGIEGLGPECSPFTQEIADGVAVGWEPADPRPGMGNMSLGEHRTRVIAAALVRHAVEPGNESRASALHGALVEARIDPQAPWRNLSSPDLAVSFGRAQPTVEQG